MNGKDRYMYNKLKSERKRLEHLLYYSALDNNSKLSIEKMIKYIDNEIKVLSNK